MVRALVTGASGFLGRALVNELLNQGHEVVGCVRQGRTLENQRGREGYSEVHADLDEYRELPNRVVGSVDTFYHFAWQGIFGEAFHDHHLQLSNAAYSADAAAAAAALGARSFIFAGTVNQYSALEIANDSSDRPMRYTNVYGTSKLSAEIICKTIATNRNMKFNSGRIAMVYGEGNSSQMLPNVVISQLHQGFTPQLLPGDALYDLIYVHDVARAFVAIGQGGADRRSYYIGSRTPRTFRNLFSEIRDVVAPGMGLDFGAFANENPIPYDLIDMESLHRDTGFESSANFKETIRTTADWLRDHPLT